MVNNVKLLKTLMIGQLVRADFAAKQMSSDGVEPCRATVSLSAPRPR